jgi:hypothetical protein
MLYEKLTELTADSSEAMIRGSKEELLIPGHPERSEGSQDTTPLHFEILRFAQDDGR